MSMNSVSDKPAKADRRVKYTKMVLKESLTALMREKPIARISIKEICEKADINRATFYAHYRDQYDLLEQIEAEVLADVNAYLDRAEMRIPCTLPVLEELFGYIDENSELCSILLSRTGDGGFRNDITEIVKERCRLSGADAPNSENADINAYVYIFAASGCIELVSKWLADGKKLPCKTMAALVYGLTNKGMSMYTEGGEPLPPNGKASSLKQ